MSVAQSQSFAPAPAQADAPGADLSAELPDLSGITPVERLPGGPFQFLFFLVWNHVRLPVACSIAAVATATAVDSFGPYVLGRIVNQLTALSGAGLEAWPASLTWSLVTLGALWCTGALLFRVHEAIDIYVSPPLRAFAQRYMFGYLLGHSHRYFQDNFAGKLGQKVKQGGQASMGLMAILFFDVVRLVTLMAVAGVLLFQAQAGFAVTLFAWTAIYLVVVIWLAQRCVVLSKAMSDEVSTSTGRLIDAISNADLIRAFAKGAFENAFISVFLRRERSASENLRWFLIAMRSFMAFANILLMLALAVFAARGAISGAITIGTFTMVFFFSNMIARSVQELSYRMLDFFEQLGTLAEALDLVTQPHEIQDAPDAGVLSVPRGRIDIEDVTFNHKDGTTLFDKLNLSIRAGEKVGLVGHSGAGKSTLVKLLRRQYEPLGGRIVIDGQDIALVSQDSLNRAIAEVPQTPGVFHRTVRDNIRYDNPRADDARVRQAAMLAHAHEFIMARPAGYGTIVGEQGIKLSGGERQRLAIARAFLKDAPILILDEATSSLDSESEHLIQSALFRLMEGRTVIAIAHRLSTIVGMDRILYMDAGQIIEEGSHGDLVARQGAYARLWNRQVAGFIDAT